MNSAIVTSRSVHAIKEDTGAWTLVTPDERGRVPAGYRVPTAHDRALARGAELRSEITRLLNAGRFAEAAEARRTLADGRATGVIL